jgi:hypothetical protein
MAGATGQSPAPPWAPWVPAAPLFFNLGHQPELAGPLAWAQLEASPAWSNGTVQFFNYLWIIYKLIQIKFKSSKICSNSNKFDKKLNSISLFEFKHIIENQDIK